MSTYKFLHLKFRYGHTYKLRFVARKHCNGHDGLCEEPHEGAEIWIANDLRGDKLAETIIHEIIHAWDFRLSECAVDDLTQQMIKSLLQCGCIRE